MDWVETEVVEIEMKKGNEEVRVRDGEGGIG